MPITYFEEHGDLNALAGRPVSIIGYGSLGRPLAFNMRDSGVIPLIGVRTDEGRTAAGLDGFEATSIEAAVQRAHIIFLLLPDEAMPGVYLQQVSPFLQRNNMLVFSSAYNITFGFIEAPPFVDVGLIAPRILGAAVREAYLAGRGFHSFLSVGQDASGQAWPTLLALAKAGGALRAGALEMSFEREAELDLFNQQVILPVLHHVLTTAANLLLAKGYPPEAVFTELYLSGELIYYLEQVAEHGLLNALRMTTLTHQYGTLGRLDRFNDLKLERLMEVTLDEIHSGKFAQEWAKEYADGHRLKTLLKSQAQQHEELWELEQQTLEALGRTVAPET